MKASKEAPVTIVIAFLDSCQKILICNFHVQSVFVVYSFMKQIPALFAGYIRTKELKMQRMKKKTHTKKKWFETFVEWTRS